MIEHEIKILDVDVSALTTKLNGLGFKEQAHKLFRRVIFDVSPPDTNKWVRLRTDGNKTTLTYKNFRKDAIDGVEEVEVTVDDFEKTRALLMAAGLKSTSYQENKRVEFDSPDGATVTVSIDSWPRIPSYLEIEGSTSTDVELMLDRLDVQELAKTSVTTQEIYKRYGLDLSKIIDLRF